MKKALLDACALVRIQSCDLLISTAQEGVYQPLWSGDILWETTNALRAKLALTEEAIAKRISNMTEKFPSADVVGYEPLTTRIGLRDPNDRHVIAAALAGEADYIITDNMRDFRHRNLPKSTVDESLARPITVLTADDFLCAMYEQNPRGVQNAITAMAARRKNPPITRERLMGQLNSGDFPRLVTALMRDETERRAQRAEPIRGGRAMGSTPFPAPNIPRKDLRFTVSLVKYPTHGRSPRPGPR